MGRIKSRLWSSIIEALRSPKAQKIADKGLEIVLFYFILFLFFPRTNCEFAIVLMALCLIIRRIGADSFIPRTPLNWLILLFILSMAVSTVISPIPLHSWNKLKGEVPRILIIFFACIEYLKDERSFKRLFWVAALIPIVFGLDGIYQYLTGFDLFKHRPLHDGRVTAISDWPTFFEYIVPFVPIMIALLVRKTKVYLRLFLAIGTAVAITAIILSQARATWIGLALALIVMLIMSRKRAFYAIFILVLVIALLFSPFPNIRSRTYSILKFRSEQRIDMWKAGIRLFKVSPYIGLGSDIFELYQIREDSVPLVFSADTPRDKTLREYPYKKPHNIYLELAIAQGLFGLLSFMAILLVLVVQLFSLRRLKDELHIFHLGITGGLVAYLVAGMTGMSIYSFWCYSLFWLFAGMTVALKNLQAKILSNEK